MGPETDVPTDQGGPRRGQPGARIAVAAVAVVIALVAAVALGWRDGGDDTDVAADSVTSDADGSVTTEGPEVLGERVVRDRDGDADRPPATACVRSTDPACGPFRWEPAPVDQPATLTIRAPKGPIVAGAPVSLLLEMSDPDGSVTLDCYSVNLDRPGLATGTCVAERIECPERYGPWPAPPPQPGQATTDVEVRFDEPGPYVVTVDVSAAAGCDDVDPYRSGATATLTVEVQPA